MGYPDSVLDADETVLWHRHPHFTSVLPAAVLAPVITGAAGVLGGLIEKHASGTVSTALYGVLAAVWLALMWWRCLWPWLAWRATHFAVTDRRVMVRQGVLSRRGFEVELDRIGDVRFTRTLIQRMFGAGTLVLRSPAADPLEFGAMPGARRVRDLIRREAGWE